MNATRSRWTYSRDSDGDWQIHSHLTDGHPIAIMRTESEACRIATLPDMIEVLQTAESYFRHLTDESLGLAGRHVKAIIIAVLDKANERMHCDD